jgi:anti-sigma regulatory factor (Ser/Thr protein kinase)
VPIARALIRSALAETSHPVDGPTVELLVSELVANAVEHTGGRGPIELIVRLRSGGCHIEVHDRDPAPPGDLAGARSDPYELKEHGRGLLLIRTLSERSGYRITSSGKAVWFTLPTQHHGT